jgi:hypothetical protein
LVLVAGLVLAVLESPRQPGPVHATCWGRAWATRVVEAAVVVAFACCISSMRSMLRTRRKVGSGSVMEMTVAAEEKRGARPRGVLRTSVRSDTGEWFSERASAIFFWLRQYSMMEEAP